MNSLSYTQISELILEDLNALRNMDLKAKSVCVHTLPPLNTAVVTTHHLSTSISDMTSNMTSDMTSKHTLDILPTLTGPEPLPHPDPVTTTMTTTMTTTVT
jgi:hypothetical protein